MVPNDTVLVERGRSTFANENPVRWYRNFGSLMVEREVRQSKTFTSNASIEVCNNSPFFY